MVGRECSIVPFYLTAGVPSVEDYLLSGLLMGIVKGTMLVFTGEGGRGCGSV